MVSDLSTLTVSNLTVTTDKVTNVVVFNANSVSLGEVGTLAQSI